MSTTFRYVEQLTVSVAARDQPRSPQIDLSESWLEAVQANPRFSTLYFFQVVSLALAGRQEEARPIVRRLLELEPGFRLRVIFEVGMVRAVADRFVEGARILGLPE